MSERSGAGVRAIDHVGVTVPDIEAAARFFADALGAEPLYEMAPTQPATDENARLEQAQLGTRPGTRWRQALMMRLGDGPCNELFDDGIPEPPSRRDSDRPGRPALRHLRRRHRCGARPHGRRRRPTALDGVNGPEAGDGNKWLYVQAPWGGVIELVTYPSSQPWEQTTSLRRWKPALAEEPTPDRKESP